MLIIYCGRPFCNDSQFVHRLCGHWFEAKVALAFRHWLTVNTDKCTISFYKRRLLL